MNPIDLFTAAREVQDFCDGREWHSCFIGGVAVQRWGQARVTRDVDITLLTGFGGEAPFIREFLPSWNWIRLARREVQNRFTSLVIWSVIGSSRDRWGEVADPKATKKRPWWQDNNPSCVPAPT